MMLGEVGFEKYPVRCRIGVYEQEKNKEQTLYIDLKATIDLSKCAESDELQDTLDYTQLASICDQIVKAKQYKLLEALLYDLSTAILQLPKVKKVWLRINKKSQFAGQPLQAFAETTQEAL